MWRGSIAGFHSTNLPLSHTYPGCHKPGQRTSKGRTRGRPDTQMSQHEIHQFVRNQNIIWNISPHGIAMEIFNEGFVLTRTTSPATKTILGLWPLRKKRGVRYPHQINAENGTPTHRPLSFRTHRRDVQKNNSQDVKHDVPQTLNQSKSFWHLGPINL